MAIVQEAPVGDSEFEVTYFRFKTEEVAWKFIEAAIESEYTNYNDERPIKNKRAWLVPRLYTDPDVRTLASAVASGQMEQRRVEVDLGYTREVKELEFLSSDLEDVRDGVSKLLKGLENRGVAAQNVVAALTKPEAGDDSFFDLINAALFGDTGPDTFSLQDAIETLEEGDAAYEAKTRIGTLTDSVSALRKIVTAGSRA